MSLDAAQSQKHMPEAASGVMNQVMGRRWMVAAGRPLAAQAAARILEAGGNAIDAGAGAGMMLGVVHPDMVSFAGVGPILVHVARSRKTYEVTGVGGHVVPVLFLDADVAANADPDRRLTDHLYGGDLRYLDSRSQKLGLEALILLLHQPFLTPRE